MTRKGWGWRIFAGVCRVGLVLFALIHGAAFGAWALLYAMDGKPVETVAIFGMGTLSYYAFFGGWRIWRTQPKSTTQEETE